MDRNVLRRRPRRPRDEPPVGVKPLPPAAAAGRAQRLVLGLAACAGAPTPPPEAWIPGQGPIPEDADDEWLRSRALVEQITATEQAISWLRAEQCAALAELESMPGPDPLSQRTAAEGEIAAALVITRHAASVRLDDAGTLSRLPRVMALLRSGLIDTRRAEAVAHTMNEHLPYGDERWSLVEERVCARAPQRTAAQLRSDVMRAVLVVDPEAAERKRERAVRDRQVRMWPRPDGMGVVEATLTAEGATLIDTVLTLLADAHRDAAARTAAPDPRTHDQRRADALTGIFSAILDGRALPLHPLLPGQPAPAASPGTSAAGTAGTGSAGTGSAGTGSGAAGSAFPVQVPAWWEPPAVPRQQRRRPHLVVTIHAETLAGLDDLPGDLASYGAISAQAARDLARRCGTAELVILDPPSECGDCRAGPGPHPAARPAAAATEPRYRPSDRLLSQVTARHRTCRAPGCRRRAEQCDVDHVIPYATSRKTCACNLIPLCRHHHRLKTFGGWQVEFPNPDGDDDVQPGTVIWTSPLGYRYIVPPADQPGSEAW